MRRLVLFALALAACTPSGAPAPAPAPTLTPPPPAASASPQPRLPAAEPVLPTLRAFRDRAREACVAAAGQVQAAPLLGDPLRHGATAADQRAAVAHYGAMGTAWTAVADDLFTFGMPEHKAARKLITALDTIGQYAQQTSDLISVGNVATAQAGVAAVEEGFADADRLARRLGIPPLSECGQERRRLRGATRITVGAYDFGFDVEAAAPGPTRFVLRNRGDERHHLFVVRLRNSGTLAEAIRADRAGEAPGAFLAGRGSASAVARPGERATVDVRLRSGSYGLLCFVASLDGTPHAYKGMATEIFVP